MTEDVEENGNASETELVLDDSHAEDTAPKAEFGGEWGRGEESSAVYDPGFRADGGHDRQRTLVETEMQTRLPSCRSTLRFSPPCNR